MNNDRYVNRVLKLLLESLEITDDTWVHNILLYKINISFKRVNDFWYLIYCSYYE